MYKEIHSLEEFVSHIKTYQCLDCVVCQGLDLRSVTSIITAYPADGAAFLGCQFEQDALQHIYETGGIVFPRLNEVPYRPYRPTLYTVDELMDGFHPDHAGSFFENAYDSVIYHHFSKYRNSDKPLPLLEALAQRLHDLSIDDALNEVLRENPRVVAIMGGHRMKRSTTAYRDVALIAYHLTKAGYFVATGGGPGAMEAGNLGAWLSNYDVSAIDKSIQVLSQETDFSKHKYLQLGQKVRDAFPDGAENLAIPTWFYGHEPTNQFATHIAKYFANSIREDILLAIATSGVIFAPGSAGTIQEIFMDAAQNHYGSFKVVSPMVFFGTTFWIEENPVYPLIQKLSASKQYGSLLTISDSVQEITSYIISNSPVIYDQHH